VGWTVDGGGICLGQRCYTTQNTSLSIKFLKWNFKSLKGSGEKKPATRNSQCVCFIWELQQQQQQHAMATIPAAQSHCPKCLRLGQRSSSSISSAGMQRSFLLAFLLFRIRCFFFAFFYVHAKPNSLNGSNDAGRTSPKQSLEKGAQLGCICNELPLQQQQQQQQPATATAMAISNMAA